MHPYNRSLFFAVIVALLLSATYLIGIREGRRTVIQEKGPDVQVYYNIQDSLRAYKQKIQDSINKTKVRIEEKETKIKNNNDKVQSDVDKIHSNDDIVRIIDSLYRTRQR